MDLHLIALGLKRFGLDWKYDERWWALGYLGRKNLVHALMSEVSSEVPGVVTGQVVKERLGLVIVTGISRSLFLLVGDIFRVSGFFPIQRLVVCPISPEEVG